MNMKRSRIKVKIVFIILMACMVMRLYVGKPQTVEAAGLAQETTTIANTDKEYNDTSEYEEDRMWIAYVIMGIVVAMGVAVFIKRRKKDEI